MDLSNLITQYKTADADIEAAEKQLTDAKAKRSEIAKTILDTHGNQPFQMDGKEVVVANMKGSYFVRTPFGGGKKKTDTASA
jgi:hypothetical protein